jgi:galacturan 1,4-alpha-galacturonidase
MRLQIITVLASWLAALPFASQVLASPAVLPPISPILASPAVPDQSPGSPSIRPVIKCHPKSPKKPPPVPPPRSKVCYVKTHNDGVTDDSKYVLDALQQCNHGGHVIFKKGSNYTIGTALDLTFLDHIDIGEYCRH